VRYPRDYGYGVPENGPLRSLEIGRGETLREGKDAALVAVGSMVMPCLEAAGILEQKGISVTVVNARFVKPLDEDLIRKVAASTDLVVTVEENSIRGGFGSAVALCLEAAGISVAHRAMGIPDEFVEHAPRGELLSDLGLTAEGIAGEVGRALGISANRAKGARAPGGGER
jgi:1-deoxy-D-xylulose-5-phosphate synthase